MRNFLFPVSLVRCVHFNAATHIEFVWCLSGLHRWYYRGGGLPLVSRCQRKPGGQRGLDPASRSSFLWEHGNCWVCIFFSVAQQSMMIIFLAPSVNLRKKCRVFWLMLEVSFSPIISSSVCIVYMSVVLCLLTVFILQHGWFLNSENWLMFPQLSYDSSSSCNLSRIILYINS